MLELNGRNWGKWLWEACSEDRRLEFEAVDMTREGNEAG
jgi:hypothetical protein